MVLELSPAEELNDILSLYARVTQKTLLISETLGIEARSSSLPRTTLRR